MHTDAALAIESTPATLSVHVPETDAPVRPATDGGVSAEKATDAPHSEADDGETPRYTYHYEPPRVGGERYVRCTECGSESVPADISILLLTTKWL